jgi:outer membrane lipoprotein SlyB
MTHWIDRCARWALAALAVSVLAACAYHPPQDGVHSPGGGPRTATPSYGVVSAVEQVSREGVSGPGTGAAIGGAIGALIGRQIGDGDSRSTATVVGAIAGAVIGHQIDRHQRGDGQARVRVTVALDQGGELTIEEAEGQDLRPGDRVRVENNRVVRLARTTGHVQSAST